ncbi:MAG: ABC transporter substrate-binding protein, partial [Anaerolineae bacterium]
DSDVAAGPGVPASGPIPRGSWAFDPSLQPPRFDPAAASQMLEDGGWVDRDGNGVRDREGRSLSISLGVPSDRVLLGVADRVRDNWAAIGVDVTIRAMDPLSARRLLTDHTFDAMVFDWVLSDYDPDPFPLWHSSQIDDGQNFASWSDAETDRLLVDARRATDRGERVALYREFQSIFAREQPALALYYPVYTYGVAAGEVGGVQTPQLVVTPADRYYNLRDWYVETETVFLEGRGQ